MSKNHNHYDLFKKQVFIKPTKFNVVEKKNRSFAILSQSNILMFQNEEIITQVYNSNDKNHNLISTINNGNAPDTLYVTFK